METKELAGAMLALAQAEARTPEGRERLRDSLAETLRCLLGEPRPSPAPPFATTRFATAGVADALDGAADSLTAMAEHVAHLAAHARVIAQPRSEPRPSGRG